jgi:hypothetical protein
MRQNTQTIYRRGAFQYEQSMIIALTGQGLSIQRLLHFDRVQEYDDDEWEKHYPVASRSQRPSSIAEPCIGIHKLVTEEVLSSERHDSVCSHWTRRVYAMIFVF